MRCLCSTLQTMRRVIRILNCTQMISNHPVEPARLYGKRCCWMTLDLWPLLYLPKKVTQRNLSHSMTKPPFWDWRKTMYPLVNVYITMERSTMLLMGKSTISMAIFHIAMLVITRGYLLNSLDCCEISPGFSVPQILRKRFSQRRPVFSTAQQDDWYVVDLFLVVQKCIAMSNHINHMESCMEKWACHTSKIENTTSNPGDTEILDNFHSPVIHLPLIVPHPSLQKNPHLLVPVVNIRRSIKLVIVPLSRLSLAVVRFQTFYTSGCLFWQVARDCGDNPVVNLWFLKTQKHLYPLTSLTRDCRSFWEGIVFPSANYFGWGTWRLHSLQT